jgi:hypothetical protein
VIHAKIALDREAEPRRREPRIDVVAEIPLRPLGLTAVEARLLNVSSHGFMAETEALVEAGCRVWLSLPGAGRHNARVVWTRSGRVGGEFAEAIDPLLVFQALGEAKPAG